MTTINIFSIAIQIITVLFALTIHEAAHAWMADRLGDSTARYQGRISLNPLVHIDPMGTIIFPLILAIIGAPVFGWAKPVPVNPYYLRNPRRSMMYVSAAGPVMNLIAAAASIFLFIFLKKTGIIQLENSSGIIFTILLSLIVINLFLVIFNLIPIPPLDGSGILEGFLKGEAYYRYQQLKPYGFIILLLIIYTRVLDFIAAPIFMVVGKLLLL